MNEAEDLKKIGEKMKTLRRTRGYTPQYMADELEIPLTEYLQYEAGYDIDYLTLIRIADLLDISLKEFFEGF